mmetsp:Transcript_32110/g.84166  ORF Transcript_32110/g.84166 Transcript_32110/m.84166 type:complete len:215 (+) Transcript_32110:205-849(+)
MACGRRAHRLHPSLAVPTLTLRAGWRRRHGDPRRRRSRRRQGRGRARCYLRVHRRVLGAVAGHGRGAAGRVAPARKCLADTPGRARHRAEPPRLRAAARVGTAQALLPLHEPAARDARARLGARVDAPKLLGDEGHGDGTVLAGVQGGGDLAVQAAVDEGLGSGLEETVEGAAASLGVVLVHHTQRHVGAPRPRHLPHERIAPRTDERFVVQVE